MQVFCRDGASPPSREWLGRSVLGMVLLISVLSSHEALASMCPRDDPGHSICGVSILMFVVPTGTSYTTSQWVALPFRYAMDDAATFVASDGEIRGAQFERAWQRYQTTTNDPQLDAMAFARALLAAD